VSKALTQVPDANRVARASSRKKVTEDGRVLATSFRLRENDGGYLSSNWIEAIGSADTSAIPSIASSYTEKIASFDGTIVIVPVGKAKEAVISSGEIITIDHFNKKSDPSYSGIFGLTVDDMKIPEILAAVSASIKV